tara:strand:+ start:56 stop:334 length:279 start_codon:yes stop_codon:yes gene_type:complete
MLEQIEELQLDLIEIINPIGEVLEEVENEFLEFEYAFMRSFKFELIDELKTIIIKITDPICDLLEEVENKFIEFKRRNYNIIKACQKNNNIS